MKRGYAWVASHFNSFRDRLENLEPRPDPAWSVSARYWANPTWSLICLAALLFTALHPPEGLPIRFCFFHQIFGVDCPGCGMTRGLSNLWRARFGDAVGYHWFAPVTYFYLVLQAAYLFIGVAGRGWAVSILNRHDRLFRRIWIWGIVAFLIYGLARAVGQLLFESQL